MDNTGKAALRKLFTYDSYVFFEYADIARHLAQKNVIDTQMSIRIMQNTHSNDAAMLMDLIEQKYSVVTFVLVLLILKSGYAAERFLSYRSPCRNAICRGPVCAQTLRLMDDENGYNTLMSMIQDDGIHDRHVVFSRLIQRSEDKFAKEINPIKKQKLADRIEVVVGADIDSNAAYGKPDFKLFKKLRRIVSETTNPIMSEVLYYGRLAMAHAISGRVAQGMEVLEKAQSYLPGVPPSADFVCVYFCILYMYLIQFGHEPTNNIFHKILEAFNIGMNYLSRATNCETSLWKRLLMVRMVQVHLGVAVTCEVISAWNPTMENIQTAERLLCEMRRIDGHMERRNEMLFCFLSARLNMINNRLEAALAFIRKAEGIAVSAQYYEVESIRKLKKNIKLQLSLPVPSLPF